MITPKAVFFDMDGVLYDSMKNHEITWIESFKKAGIDFSAQQAYLNEGRTGNSTIHHIFRQKKGRDATEQECELIYNEKTRLMALQPQAPILPGMKELIETLRQQNITTLVVTGSRQPLLLNKLSNDFGFEPHQIVSGYNVTHGKPHPEPYLKALDKSGEIANHCVVIENAPLGIQSAKAAGIYTVAVNTGILSDDCLWQHGCDELYPDTLSFSKEWRMKFIHG